MSVTSNELLAGVTLDLAFGDPQWLPHPVRGIGRFAGKAENFWRGAKLAPRFAGGLFWLTVVGATAAFVRMTPRFCSTYWIYALLACRDLDIEAARVITALQNESLDDARRQLSWIVGRDTAHLDETEVLRATIETVAENLSDGVIAPLFYLALAGPTGMAAYKAINTLDSMVGHKNERYREFGFVSAKMDDLANFWPARITALLIWFSALLPGFSAFRSIKMTLRDGASQPSPNAGYPEAAAAGALGVQLGGLNFYGGTPSRKPTLGDPVRPLNRDAFRKVRMLLYVTEAIFVFAIVRWIKWR